MQKIPDDIKSELKAAGERIGYHHTKRVLTDHWPAHDEMHGRREMSRLVQMVGRADGSTRMAENIALRGREIGKARAIAEAREHAAPDRNGR